MTDKSMFAPIDGASAMLQSKGVYTEAPVYAHAQKLYAQAKGGFIRLLAQNLTSVGTVQWRAVEGVPFIQQHDGLRIVEPEKTNTVKNLRAAARARASKLADVSMIQ